MREDTLTGYAFYNDWNGVSPALVLFFKYSRPMPVREKYWPKYLSIMEEKNVKKLRGKE